MKLLDFFRDLFSSQEEENLQNQLKMSKVIMEKMYQCIF